MGFLNLIKKPDFSKIREIVKKFNVNYDYLLNDEIELKEDSKNISDNNDKKTRYKIILKVIFIIFLLYLLICVYKFIAFYRFYLIANSFSEENYLMIQLKNIRNQNESPIYPQRKRRCRQIKYSS